MITDKKATILPRVPPVVEAASVASVAFPSGPNSAATSPSGTAQSSALSSVTSSADASTLTLASSVDSFVPPDTKALEEHENSADERNIVGQQIVAGEIDVSIRLARVDNGTTPAVSDSEHGTLSAAGMHAGNDAGLTTNRTDVMVDTPEMGNHGASGHFGSTLGLMYGSATWHVAADDADGTSADAAANTQVGLWGANVGNVGTLGVTAKTTVNGVGLNGGITMTGAAEGQVKVLGQDTEKRAVMEYRDTLSAGGQLMGGVSLGAVGIGFRLGASGSRGIVFRTLRTADEATALLRKGGRLRGFAAALRLHAPLISLPNLKDPLNLRSERDEGQAPMAVGDELQISYTGTLTGGIAVTAGGVYLGAHASVTGTHTMKVSKVSETTVEMLVTPDQVTKAAAIGFDVPVLAEAHVLVSKSRATSHGYSFDLSDTHGMAAYLKALEGHLPGPLMRVENYEVFDAKGAQEAVAQTDLGKGVKYLLLEQAAMPAVKSGGFSFPAAKHIPYAKLSAIGLEKSIVHENTVVADGATAVHKRSVSYVAEQQALHLGVVETKSFGVMNTVHHGRTDDFSAMVSGLQAGVKSVELGVKIATSRSNPWSLNKVVKTLNKHLSPTVPMPQVPAAVGNSKYGLEVGVKQTLSHPMLRELAPAGTSPLEHAAFLQNKVAAGGLRELVAIKAALGEAVPPLGVSVQSEAPNALHDKALNLAYLNRNPIDPKTDSRHAVDQRVRKVNKYLQDVAKVRHSIEVNPLSLRFDGESRAKQLESLRQTEANLKKQVDLSHLRNNPDATNSYRLVKARAAQDVRELFERLEKEEDSARKSPMKKSIWSEKSLAGK